MVHGPVFYLIDGRFVLRKRVRGKIPYSVEVATAKSENEIVVTLSLMINISHLIFFIQNYRTDVVS